MSIRTCQLLKYKNIIYCLVFSLLFLISFLYPLNFDTQKIEAIKKPNDNAYQMHPNYIDDRLIGLGEWKEKFGSVDNILVSDSIAYVSGGDNSLVIYNISDVKDPKIISIYDSQIQETNDIYLQGDVLILSGGTSGFEIIDITDLSNPYRLYYNFNFNTEETIFYNDYLIIADTDTDLRIFDATDLTNLEQVAYTYDGSYGAYSIEIVDHYAIIADGVEGLEVFDIQDILNPVEVGSYTETNNNYFLEITVIDSIAYVLNSNNTLLFFNVSDITNPTL
ncbi:MAG: hypothetical protein FK731_10825, partial [Asgard group archaeon]|nr:hypothetical protein [Asgard group archaeon]